ncbi:unnamed protein product [Phyllotreta striolata]|uniref:Serpin domain-containing protein n=1 Tax=Phyllotreta striolata TaxID=444603 RepID=A0A9N9TTR7_PHYSR|nr:unnamed protein product [Phyllotreta striolata]
MKVLLLLLLATSSWTDIRCFQPPPSDSDDFLQVVTKSAYDKYGLALEAIFSMGLRLQGIMDTSTEDNFVVSPLSTTAIIGQMLLGANGEFREQLYQLLSLPKMTTSFRVTYYNQYKGQNDTQVLPYAMFHMQLAALIKELRHRKPGEEFVLTLDNALFHEQRIRLNEVFEHSLNNLYHTEITPLDFRTDTSRIINDWASTHTNGLIKSFLSGRLPPSTAALFLNSIYFLAEWETPFADLLNNVDDFHVNANKTARSTFMMGNIIDIPFVQTKNFRMVCLPYKKREVGMYILLPNIDHEHKYNIKKFTEQTSAQEILKAFSDMRPHDVTVKIPKVALSNTLDILRPLQKYASFDKYYNKMRKTGSANVNSLDEITQRVRDYKNFRPHRNDDVFLTNAAVNVPLRVSDIFQQMVFSINEKGTEAAAVTGGFTDYMGGGKSMVLNRPFSFFIRHEETQAALFWGTISNPAKN